MNIMLNIYGPDELYWLTERQKIMPNYAKYVFSPKLAETNVIGVFI